MISIKLSSQSGSKLREQEVVMIVGGTSLIFVCKELLALGHLPRKWKAKCK